MPDAYPDDPSRTGIRVLVGSHSHPSVQNGGSEVASHALFERLRTRPGWTARYLGCARGGTFVRAGQSITQPFADDDHLYTVGDFEGFKFANRDMAFPRDFRALLKRFDPQIVHLHHYVNFGVEALFHVRDALPDARLVLTLHEFLAICHQQGQMVKRGTNALCFRADPVACARCFPEVEPADFFLRTLFVRRFFDCVDHVVAPSRFLADRYVAWGVPAGSISVIENVPRALARPPSVARGARPGRLRVGFFGQISELKGMEVLLDAAELLREDGHSGISIAVHGDHRNQPPTYQEAFLGRIGGSGVSFHGAYDNDAVDALMRSVDLVVVPSIWWENSPVVIQEAFRNGRAVLCSGIGGMAEKVVPGETGAHFAVGSARALADALVELAADPDRIVRLGEAAALRWDAQGPFDAHLSLYRRLLDARTGRPAADGAAHMAQPYRISPSDLLATGAVEALVAVAEPTAEPAAGSPPPPSVPSGPGPAPGPEPAPQPGPAPRAGPRFGFG